MKTEISNTKRFVFDVEVLQNDFVTIDRKLPLDAKCVTGVYFSIPHTAQLKGNVSLRFSEGTSNPLLFQVVRTIGTKRKKGKYIPVCEPVSDSSTVQGYYNDLSGDTFTAYNLKIYIEYIPR